MEETEKGGPFCQSCGMPMRKPDDFGTNGDGTKNGNYCSLCFQEGRFSEPEITLEQMITRVASILKEKMGLSETEANEIAKGTIPKLLRWRK